MKSPDKLTDTRLDTLVQTPTLHDAIKLASACDEVVHPQEIDDWLFHVNCIVSPILNEEIYVELLPDAYAFDLDDNPFQMTNGTYRGKFRGFTASSDTIRQETGAVCLSIDAIFPDGSNSASAQSCYLRLVGARTLQTTGVYMIKLLRYSQPS